MEDLLKISLNSENRKRKVDALRNTFNHVIVRLSVCKSSLCISAEVNIRLSVAFTVSTARGYHVDYYLWNDSTDGQARC